MKKIFIISIFCLPIVQLNAQQAPPEGINYQATLYVPSEKPLPGTNGLTQVPANREPVEVIFTIEQGLNGSIMYQEVHKDTTDEFGLLDLIIGQGSALLSPFNQVDWSIGDAYLKTSITIESTGTIISSNQKLWSVPYALFSGRSITTGHSDSSAHALVSDTARSAWSLIGNSGTNPNSNFIGTSDSVDLVIKTNDLERVRVSNNGNIGIGTSNPIYKFTTTYGGNNASKPFGITDLANNPRFNISIEGDTSIGYTNVRFDLLPLTNSEQAQLRFFRSTNTTGPKSVVFFRGNGTTQGSAQIGIDGVDSYFQLQGGNFGIGTATPLGRFHVNNDINGNDSSFIITPDGDVGIGLIAPLYKLDIATSSNFLWSQRIRNTGGSGQGLLISAGSPTSLTSALQVENNANNILFKVQSNGFVGIGTPTPARTLHVNAAMRLEPIASPPTSPSKGDMYFDSVMNKLRVYDGTTWQNCW